MTLWRDLVNDRLANLHADPADKLLPMAEAVRKHVRPGMKLNMVALQSRPSALTFELCRAFAGKNPGFEYISSSIGATALATLHLGLFKKIIVSYAGESYPTPGPSKVVQRAIAAGLDIENWTMLTISQRLLGGAMGVPWFPTRSLAGSSIGDEQRARGNYMDVDDPARPGETFGLLKSYRPDISFVHAWAADRAGNAIVYPPYGENVYGPLAAREGVILTADHIVDTDFIREHAPLVRIPAAIVRSVSHAPYGCHPSGNFAQAIGEFRPYGNDYAFMRAGRQTQGTRESYEAWVREWILDVKDHSEYLRKLGNERIEYLHKIGAADGWRAELEKFAADLDLERPASPIENMIVQASRVVAARMTAKGLKTVLSGVGQATLMAWLAAHAMRKQGKEITMMAETGIYGHDPRPADPFVFNFFNLHTTTVLTDIFETLGLHTGGAANQCLGTFGAGEIDRFGNVNSTKSADGSFIVGSGGANDIATAAVESVVVAQQRLQTFVDRVEYITSPGKRISALISTMGRFEKRGGDEFVLTGYFGLDGLTRDEAVREIKDRCGWELQIAPDVEALAPATPEELALLRMFDPERFFLGKPVETVQAVAAK
jgi:acyl CoA:acetate/3-ketoacid CoA transferase alpha subunit/acyl CoA:acetate/3-ketoacid CoA transferase beta subunit